MFYSHPLYYRSGRSVIYVNTGAISVNIGFLDMTPCSLVSDYNFHGRKLPLSWGRHTPVALHNFMECLEIIIISLSFMLPRGFLFDYRPIYF